MSLRTVMKLSADWHEAVANNLDGPQYSFPKPWLPATRLNGYEIVPIANGADLYREGAAMRHCVGSYGSLVTRGDCYIYSVREDGKRVATAEIIRADGRIRPSPKGDRRSNAALAPRDSSRHERVMTRPPSAFRQSDLTKAVKAVIAAGLHVAGVKVNAQGDIEVVTGEEKTQGPSTAGENEWDRI